MTVLAVSTRVPKTENTLERPPAQSEQAMQSVAAPARDLYLKAHYLRHQESPASLAEALEIIEQSIALSPEFAVAHAFLAEVLFLHVERGLLAPDAGFARGREAARRALDLDPD